MTEVSHPESSEGHAAPLGHAQGVCVCGQNMPVFERIAELPGSVLTRCCGALYVRRGPFLSLINQHSAVAAAGNGAGGAATQA